MKISVKLGIIATIFTLFSFMACQKEQAAVSVAPEVATHQFDLSKVNVVDGRLVFKTEKDLNTLLEEMFKNQNSLNNFDAHFKGFTSQNTMFNSFNEEALIKTNGDLTPFKDYIAEVRKSDGVHLDRVVSEPLAARLVNSEGLIQVGEVVMKMTRNYAYQFNVSALESYKANKNSLSSIPNVSKKDVERTTQDIDIDGLQTRGFITSNELVYQRKNNKDFRKVRGELEATDPLFSAWRTAYVRIKHEKRAIFGSWSSEQTDELKISGTVALRQFLPGTGGATATPGSPFSLNQTQTFTGEFSINVATNDQSQFYEFRPTTNVTFRAFRLDTGTPSNPSFATCDISL